MSTNDPEALKSPDIQIRNYDPVADFQGLTDTLVEAELSTEYCSKEELARWADIQPRSIIVAESGGNIVGTVFFQDGVFPFIYRLGVRRDYRGQGIATALLSEAEKRAKEAGHNRVELNIGEDHPELLKFYEDRGYSFRFNITSLTKPLE